jgi:hypothetical protein
MHTHYILGPTPIHAFKGLLVPTSVEQTIQPGQFGIELSQGFLVLACRPPGLTSTYLATVASPANSNISFDGLQSREVTDATVLVLRGVEWKFTATHLDVTDTQPRLSDVLLSADGPQIVRKAERGEVRTISLLSGELSLVQQIEDKVLKAREWRLDGYLKNDLVISVVRENL